jgi:AcrR family transcriptional regulator
VPGSVVPHPRSLATRARILTAARELLGQGGAAACSLERVARRAGVTRATVYQHFGSKQRLLEALLSAEDRQPAAESTRQQRALDEPEAVLMEVIRERARAWIADAAVLRRVHGLVAATGALAEHEGEERARAVVLAIVVCGLAERGLLRPGVDRRTAFEALRMLTSFAATEHLHLRGGLSPEQVERTLVALAQGVVALPSSSR